MPNVVAGREIDTAGQRILKTANAKDTKTKKEDSISLQEEPRLTSQSAKTSAFGHDG
jgi:hypothetical protein